MGYIYLDVSIVSLFIEYLSTLHANYVWVKDLFHFLENHLLN